MFNAQVVAFTDAVLLGKIRNHFIISKYTRLNIMQIKYINKHYYRKCLNPRLKTKKKKKNCKAINYLT